MNWTTIGLGLAMVAFGLTTSILRVTSPHLFAKLEPMKERWGPRAGLWIHVLGYSVVPVVGGALIALGGVAGMSFF
jgi:hypothetical protein